MYKLQLKNPANGKGFIETFSTVRALNAFAEKARAAGLEATRRKELERK